MDDVYVVVGFLVVVTKCIVAWFLHSSARVYWLTELCLGKYHQTGVTICLCSVVFISFYITQFCSSFFAYLPIFAILLSHQLLLN